LNNQIAADSEHTKREHGRYARLDLTAGALAEPVSVDVGPR
jgi:hypothetical protein